MYQYKVIIIIPESCNRPSVEITYDVAGAIESLRYTTSQNKKKIQACKIVKEEWMIWREDGTVRIDFNAANMEVVEVAIDEVMRAFQTSIWQQNAEKMVDKFDKKNLKRAKGTSGKVLIYKATEYVDESSSDS
jgi:hypothetical protein